MRTILTGQVGMDKKPYVDRIVAGGGNHDPALNFNYWGLGGAVTPSAVDFPYGPDDPIASYAVDFPVVAPAHGAVIVMHFCGQHANADHAAALESTAEVYPWLCADWKTA